VRNKHRHASFATTPSDYHTYYLSTWIRDQFKNFRGRLNKTKGALHFEVGEKSFKPAGLKPPLSQDICRLSLENQPENKV